MTRLPTLGVEATGVGTTVILVQDAEVVYRSTEAPLNLLHDATAFERLAEIIKQSGAAAAGLGLSGLRSARQGALLEMQLRARTGVVTVVGDDTEAAQLGAFGGEPGIIVIAHTGSNSFGRNAEGRAARSGGNGRIVGDEGSHYWIGTEALRQALRSRDGRGAKSPRLEKAISDAFGVDLETMTIRVTEQVDDASLAAQIASATMNVKEPILDQILGQAADDLVAHVSALRATLGELPVAMSGSVFDHPYIRERFVASTGAVDAAAAPVFGAVVLAGLHTESRDMGW